MSDELQYDDQRCRGFNESLDEEGEVVIANIPFQRSRILFELANSTRLAVPYGTLWHGCLFCDAETV